MSGQLFDLLLVGALAWTAWRTLTTPDAFTAAVLFITFGLLMALGWARLEAPDVALAEAAIGAGLTGALVLDAIGHERAARRDGQLADEPQGRAPPALVVALCLGVALLLGGAIVTLGEPAPAIPVAAAMPASGVSHPVTAVLLNFRAYDTLLEVAVLLLALMAVLAARAAPPRGVVGAPDPVLATLVRVLLPVMVVAAGYLLWAGSFRPGGAFQAGAVLAAAGVLLRLAGSAAAWSLPGAWLRAVSCAGLLLFLAVAGAVRSDRLLEYPPSWAGALIVAIEATLAVSLGTILAGFFLAAPEPARDREKTP